MHGTEVAPPNPERDDVGRQAPLEEPAAGHDAVSSRRQVGDFIAPRPPAIFPRQGGGELVE